MTSFKKVINIKESFLKKPTSQTPLVTYHVISFNRLHFLRNLIESFKLCNVYPNYEWIIFVYGSKDSSRDYLSDLSKTDRNFKVVFEDESIYFDFLTKRGLAPKFKNQKLAAIAPHFRNEVRKIAKGDLFFDLADDHQFIRRGDWVNDILSIYHHRTESNLKDDITGIVLRAYMYKRHLKSSNRISQAGQTPEGIHYFVYHQKVYDVYSVMKRSTFQSIGPFFEIHHLTDPQQIKGWQDNTAFIDLYPDYCKRAANLGYKRVLMKLPYLVEFPNEICAKIKPTLTPPFVPLFEPGQIEGTFDRLQRPVSSDDIFLTQGIRTLLQPKGVAHRNFYMALKRISNWFK